MLTTINKILSHNHDSALPERLESVFGEDYDHDQEFDVVDWVAHSKGNVLDVLEALGHEGKSAIACEFAKFCATTSDVPPLDQRDLANETIALFSPDLSKSVLRDMANAMKDVKPSIHKYAHTSPVWRKRRAIQQALLARASENPVHAAHYAAYAYTWSYQVSARGLKEHLIELLLEDK